MILSILLAALHYLALGIGLGALFVRGRCFKALKQNPQNPKLLSALFLSDNFWGISAFLWIATGLARLFGGLEKTPSFYWGNGFFWLKMGLFLAIFLIELVPMVKLIQARIKLKKGQRIPLTPSLLDKLFSLNHMELVLLFLIPFAAAGMARGVWLF